MYSKTVKGFEYFFHPLLAPSAISGWVGRIR